MAQETAVAYGAVFLAGLVAHALMAFGLAAGPAGVTYRPIASELALIAVWTLAAGAVAAGGALLLRRSPAGVAVVRAGAAATAFLTVGRVAYTVSTNPVYAALWSTPAPATATVQTHYLLNNLWVPALLAALTWLLPRRAT
ncbi:MAG: hypothetical protein JWO31_3702 [Phycisphaerales bacterium]|nr:hypothetical protein [Phycisphaerales bacterium]